MLINYVSEYVTFGSPPKREAVHLSLRPAKHHGGHVPRCTHPGTSNDGGPTEECGQTRQQGSSPVPGLGRTNCPIVSGHNS